jgi:SRSO17 transposase
LVLGKGPRCQAYGDNTALRDRLHDAGREYVLAVGKATKVFAAETVFAVPDQTGKQGRPGTRLRADGKPEAIGELIARVGAENAQIVAFRDGPDGKPVSSRFVFARVRAAHGWQKGTPALRRQELLIAEWRTGEDAPLDYWLSNLPADSEPERLARLARLRWKIELDYKQLKGELGLDHYEGRSWIGWHHHSALVTVAHGFLTLERLCREPRGWPDTPPDGAGPPARPQVLGQPLPNLPPARRPRPAHPLHPTRVTKH